ncbi:MAG: hypothetical protein C4541_09505 [Candidatus Auribacter fodinae]|uniref:LamG-like jellyroll fold domain-containing protein n=1 Tax=Candidatus Auribacter fodinae TaxID=2093366 RepID=A0A3A4R4S0_9BACT|nr:MAG: hypothetical protein C4541_09505 [Candidatus Auribacter fodinae]
MRMTKALLVAVVFFIIMVFSYAGAYSEELAETIYYHVLGRTIEYNNKIYCFGGYSWYSGYGVNGANKSEVYDPAANTWAELANMPETRSHFALFELDDRIFLIGGQRWQGNLSDAVYAYNPATNSWSESSNYGTLPNKIISPQCATVNGTVYLMFGSTSIYGSPGFALDDIYKFNPDAENINEQWEPQGAPMPYPVEWGSMEVHDGKIYVFGCGHQEVYGTHFYRTRIQIYDPETKKWSFGRKLDDDIYIPAPETTYGFYFDTVKQGNKAYLFVSYRFNTPGSSSTIKDKVYVYNFETDAWTWMDFSDFLASASLYHQTLHNDLTVFGNDVYFMDQFDFTRKKVHRLDLTSLEYLPCSPAGEITHDIDELRIDSAGTYQVETVYYLENITSIFSCTLEIYDPEFIETNNIDNEGFIRIKVWYDGDLNTWTAPQQGYSGTYNFYPQDAAYPPEYIYLDSSTLSVSITPEPANNRVKILWNFKLNSSNPWRAGSTSLNYVLFRSRLHTWEGGSVEKGVWTNEDSVAYFNNLSEPAGGSKAIYLWDETITLLDSELALKNFLSFVNAPHGIERNKIDTVFFAFRRDGQYLKDYPVNHEEVSKIRRFIAELHSRGIKAYYLAGDPAWALSSEISTAKQHIDAVNAYNSAFTTVLPEERFDGIHFDIEPHLLDAYKTGNPSVKGEILTDFTDGIHEYANYINGKSWYVSDFRFGVSIPFWYERYVENGEEITYCEVTHESSTKDVFKHILDDVDFISIMNYNIGADAPGLSQHELAYAGASDSVYVAFETLFNNWQDPGVNVSFWEAGNTRLDIMARRTETMYASNAALAGIAYHFYEMPSQNGYANMPLHESGARDLSSESPVCTVITPNGGESYEVSDTISVTFEVYDTDSETLYVDVDLYQGGVFYRSIATAMEVNVESAVYVTTITFSESTDAADYKIKVTASDLAEDITASDMSNFNFSISATGDSLAVYYPFDEADYNLSEGVVYDRSGNGVDASIQSAAQAYPDCDGLIGGAFRFTGGQQGFLQAISNPLAGAGTFTVSFWFKSDDLYEQSGELKNYCFVSAVTSDGGITSGLVTSLPKLELWDSSGQSFLSAEKTAIRDMDSYFIEGGWHFYSAVYNGSNVIEYIDGINRLNSFKLSTPLSGSSLRVAGGIDSLASNFNGWIDELRIHSRALTEDEILYLFNTGQGRTDQEVDSYYAQQSDDKPYLSRRGIDSDNDLLTDNDEDFGLPLDTAGNILLVGTDKYNADNDGDRLSDYAEAVAFGSSPLDDDVDNDGINDYQESIVFNTNPNFPDTIIFKEDYNAYTAGNDPNSVSQWFVFGQQHTYRIIAGDGVNNFVRIGLYSPYGDVPPVWAPIGIGQWSAWSPAKDFSNSKIAFDVKTNLPFSVPQVIGVQIFARCIETDEILPFRVPDSKLRSIPSASQGWETMVFDIAEVNSAEAYWKTPDFTMVQKIEIIFMQTSKDFYASGDVEIDNFIGVQSDEN